jgi:prophage tail gpP-like protein
MPKPQEIAVLTVNGEEFKDWTSVYVQLRSHEPFDIFNFTCTERERRADDDRSPLPSQPTLPRYWNLTRLKPGDSVTITLAGHLAITGWITVRQAAYGPQDHGVQLIGKGKGTDLARSSVDDKSGSFDQQSWSQIARKVCAPFGIGVKTEGIDEKKFDNVQVQPGELCFSFLERLARHRKIELGSTPDGNLLALAIDSKRPTAVTPLVEGVNILRATCILTDEHIHDKYIGRSQTAGSDKTAFDAVTKIQAIVMGQMQRHSPLIVPVEHPSGKEDTKKRVEYERWHTHTTMIDAEILVQGWLQENGQLWKPRLMVPVLSPMLLLNEAVHCADVTFRQDENAGTTTSLHLQWPIQGKAPYPSASDNPSPPSTAT